MRVEKVATIKDNIKKKILWRSKWTNHGHGGDQELDWRGGDRIVDLVTMGSLPQSESLGVQTHSLCP